MVEIASLGPARAATVRRHDVAGDRSRSAHRYTATQLLARGHSYRRIFLRASLALARTCFIMVSWLSRPPESPYLIAGRRGALRSDPRPLIWYDTSR